MHIHVYHVKHFFRRNAYNDHLRFTCRVRNCCEINIATRRHCAACRLNKCFQKGMKKELIRSSIAINQASTAMMMSRFTHERVSTQRSTTMDLVPSNNQSILLFNDWNIITNIRNAYENYCAKPFLASHETIPLSITTQPHRYRLKLQRLIDLKKKYFSVLSSFIKRILQFDPSIEIYHEYLKDNLMMLLTINTSELMKSNLLENLPWENDRLLFESVLTEPLLLRIEASLNIYRTLLPYDPLVVKLFMIILALTSRIFPVVKKAQYNARDFEPFPRQILARQNYYLTLFWKYIIYRFGYYEAIMYSVRFTQHFLRRQAIEADIINVIENRDDQGQFVELMEKAMTL